jgi:hypothetical protein
MALWLQRRARNGLVAIADMNPSHNFRLAGRHKRTLLRSRQNQEKPGDVCLSDLLCNEKFR